MAQISAALEQDVRESAHRAEQLYDAQVSLPRLLSGEATWFGLIQSIDELKCVAPEDHDVVIQVDDVVVLKAYFLAPHSFRFEGIDQRGHRTGVVIHFSQLRARVVYYPKRGPTRVITGFAGGTTA